MTSWSCHRLRPQLVDFADGKLAEPRRAHVEHHVASCPACADTVLELREVPGQLRRLTSASPPEDFWKRQRASILDAIDNPPAAARRESSRASRIWAWQVPMALAASLAVVVVASQWRTIPVVPSSAMPVPARPVQVASVAHPAEATSVSIDDATPSDDVLYVEDTSLLSLAEQLDEDPGDTANDSLI